MADVGALFNQGFANGLRAKQQKRDREIQNQRLEIEKRQQTEAELDGAIRRKRMQQVVEEQDFAAAARKDDAARFIEADKALEMFNAGYGLIDWGSPDSPKQYQALTQQYLPTILKHDSAAKRWEAQDKATQQGQQFTLKKALDAERLATVRRAVEMGIVSIPTTQSGEVDYETLQQKMDERKEASFQDALQLRKAAIEARGEATGVGGKMLPGAKAEIETVKTELNGINRELMNPKLTPEQKLPLVNRKSSLQKRLRRFDNDPDSWEQPPPVMIPQRQGPQAPSAPGPQGNPTKPESPSEGSKSFHVGPFKVRFIDEVEPDQQEDDEIE